MIKYYTDTELKEKLKNLEIIHDTREQANTHILDYFDKHKILHSERKLDVGDYTAQLDGYTFEKSFVVERKHNLDEICGNLTADRDRFEREFLRARAYNTKVFLVIENASWHDICLQNYRSKMSAKALKASLLAWQTRYNVTILFCNENESPELIFTLLYYSAREELLGKTR